MTESWTGKSTMNDVGNQEFKATLRAYVPRQVLRCGKFYAPTGTFDDIQVKPGKNSLKLKAALKGGKNDVHRVAGEADDANMQDFIEGELLEDQVKSIEEVSRFVGQLRRMGNKGDAVWHFDQMMLNREA